MDVEWLKTVEMQQQFRLELKNYFSILEDQETGEEHGVKERWKIIKEAAINTGQEGVGFRRGTRKEQWITQNMWRVADERRRLKAMREQAKNDKNVVEVTAAYRLKDKDMKSRCRADKELWLKNLAEAEKAAMRQDTKTMFQIARALSGKTTRKLPITDINGRSLKTHEEQAKQWREHFTTILNCQEPDVTHDFSGETTSTLEINIEAITAEEVRMAITRQKNGKSAGIDGIQAEFLKHEGEEPVPGAGIGYTRDAVV